MKRILKAWRRGGARLALRVAGDRVSDALAERSLGIESRGLVPIETLLGQWRDCHDYFPTTIRDFHRVMESLQVTPDDVFVDYGSGKGRVLTLATRYPFRRILGVEISSALSETARANLARCVAPHDRDRVEIWTGSAADYALPADASVLYFYNPFHGTILRAVFAEIRRSLLEAPRRMTVVFNNPSHFARIEGDYPWLRRVRTLSLEYDCVVYEAAA
ncbi:MAG TPA: class I SAM-dependent methyltransferase [Arenibaculum sp.]|nr:class I SAM-dependent methyltransferase [Arenibaculum sp.]